MKRSAFVLLVVTVVVACSQRDAGNREASSDKLASNPSSPTVSVIHFTAAQIGHGGVRWSQVTMSTAAATATVPGQVTPNEDRTARLGAPARGRVLSVRVQAGDPVAVGQALVTLESTDAGVAQSDVAKATAAVAASRAQAEYARSARGRAERLLTLKAIPRQDYERAIADDELAQSSLTEAQAELRRARSTAAQLGATASASGEIIIRSPLRGVVLTRTAIPGTVVDAGAPLVVVTDPTTLWLTINAPEQLSGLFQRGDQLSFTVPAFPADTFVARIASVGAGLDPDTRTLPVRGTINNTNGNANARLKPAMFANVLVTGGHTVAAVVLPDAAVQLLDGMPTVFLARPDGKGGATFTRRSVEIASRTGGRVAVSRGLRAGDVIVTSGAFAVKAEFAKGSMPRMEM